MGISMGRTLQDGHHHIRKNLVSLPKKKLEELKSFGDCCGGKSIGQKRKGNC
jgi:hypothetical protein